MIEVTFAGGDGEITTVAEDRFTMIASRAFAPGTPLTVTLKEGPSLELKVSRSARRADGRFDVDGRLVNLTRRAREALSARFATR